MAHGDAREGKWRGNWRIEWVASTLHITSEHGVSSITTAVVHTLAASNRLNWRTCWFKWTRPFCRKTKSGFCTYDITFQTQSTTMQPAELQLEKLIATLLEPLWSHFIPLHTLIHQFLNVPLMSWPSNYSVSTGIWTKFCISISEPYVLQPIHVTFCALIMYGLFIYSEVESERQFIYTVG
jgi:hypothetical protein